MANAGSHLNSKAKKCKARWVLGWGTAREIRGFDVSEYNGFDSDEVCYSRFRWSFQSVIPMKFWTSAIPMRFWVGFAEFISCEHLDSDEFLFTCRNEISDVWSYNDLWFRWSFSPRSAFRSDRRKIPIFDLIQCISVSKVSSADRKTKLTLMLTEPGNVLIVI